MGRVSQDEKKRTVVYARSEGVEKAATHFKRDPQTIKTWLNDVNPKKRVGKKAGITNVKTTPPNFTISFSTAAGVDVLIKGPQGEVFDVINKMVR